MKFDKFVLNFKVPRNEKKYAIIGYPDDFTNVPEGQIDLSLIRKKIIVGGQEIFWIYENP